MDEWHIATCHSQTPLECFSIDVRRNYWDPNPWGWNSFSSDLKDALSNIIHSSTLKTLSLDGITKVQITFFLHIVHLTTLELRFLLPNDFADENSSSLTRAASKGVASMASHSVIDQCVWRFRAELLAIRDSLHLLMSH